MPSLNSRVAQRAPARKAAAIAPAPGDRARLSRAVADPMSAPPAAVLGLQRAAGNRAVSRLIQAKLMVGGANDRYEQEADRVAESVVSSPGPASASRDRRAAGLQRQGGEEEEVQTKPLVSSISRLVQRVGGEEEEVLQGKRLIQRVGGEEEEVLQGKRLIQRVGGEEEEVLQGKRLIQREGVEEEEVLQGKRLIQREGGEEEEVLQGKSTGRDGSFEAGGRVERSLAAGRGGGAPLPDSVRAYMEPRFGTDFGGVRLHADAEAAGLNRSINARAFTHGHDIYLGAGASAPGTTDGNRLLAHELTHVIQQSGRNDRIARWGKGTGGGTPHPVVTKMAFANFDPRVRKYFSKEAQDYLSEHTDDIDKRLGYLIPVGLKIAGQKVTQARGKGMYRGGLKMKGFSKMVKKAKGGEELAETYDADAKERARQYDSAEGYVRNPAEAPNHAEGGMYKSFSGEGAGKLRIDEYINNAIKQYASGNPRDALYTLALALHTTQDKGAHGEGAPGTGHDPRKFFPPPNQHAKTGWVYWQKGKGKFPDLEFSSCDNIDQNPRGLQIAIGATHNTLRQFVEGIGVTIGDQGEQSEEELQAAGRLISWTKPGIFSRAKREVGRWLGGTGVIKNMRGMEQFG